MIFYVHRNAEGRITSIHGRKRPGYAEEALLDSNPEVIEIINKANEVTENIIYVEDIYTALVDKGILTKQDVATAKAKRPK